MTIEFRCPTCDRKLSTGEDKAGATAKCPQCGSAVVIPAAAVVADPTAATDGFGGFDTGAGEPTVPASGREIVCPMCGTANEAAAARCLSCGEELWAVATGGAAPQGALRFGSVWRAAWDRWTANLGICVAAAAVAGGIFFAAYLLMVLLMMVGVAGMAVAAVRSPDATTALVLTMMGLAYLLLFLVYSYLLAGFSQFAIRVNREREVGLGALCPQPAKFARSLVATFFVSLGLAVATLPGIGLYAFGIVEADANEPFGVLLAIAGYFLMFVGWGLGWTLFWPVHYLIADGAPSFFSPLADGVRLALANPKLSFLMALAHTGLFFAGLFSCYIGLLFSMPLSFVLFAAAFDRCRRATRVASAEPPTA